MNGKHGGSPRRAGAIAAAGLLVVVSVPAERAEAQEPEPWPGRLTVDAGIGVAGGYPVGSSRPTLTGNVVPQGGRVTLFESTVSLRRSTSFDARVGWRVSDALSVEAEFSYANTPIRVRVTGDAAGGPAVDFSTSRLEQYVIGGNLVVRPGRMTVAGGRGRPFVQGGLSYLRQLHDNRAVLDEGRVYHLGGGLHYALLARPTGALKGLALRLDARWRLREDGFELEGRRRSAAVAGAGLQARF